MANIEINLGKACNNKCKFCMSINSAPEHLKFADLQILQDELNKFKEQGYDSLGFLGGEATLYPQFVDLVKYANDIGFKQIHLITNGRKLQDKEYLLDLVNSGVTRFSVSIHSYKSEIEDNLTQIKGGFKEKLSGLKNLRNLINSGQIKTELSANLVINKKNYFDLDKFLMFFSKLGINNFRFNFLWPRGNAEDFYNELLITYNDFLPQTEKIIKMVEKLNVNLSFEGIPLCIFNNLSISNIKDFIGEIKDTNTDVADLDGYEMKRYKFNWQDRKKNELKSKRNECQQCKYNQTCDGVWQEYINYYGWDEFNPVKT